MWGSDEYSSKTETLYIKVKSDISDVNLTHIPHAGGINILFPWCLYVDMSPTDS